MLDKIVCCIIVLTTFSFQAPKVCIEQLLELQRGQGIEIFWRDNFICPSEKDYKAMAIKSKC